MKLSVVICTYDRPELLKQTIQQLTRQSLSSEEFEIIVVYNESVSATAATLESLSASVPNLRTFTESMEKGGLAHARNIGYKAAESDLVYYLDDDVTPQSQLLETMWETFETIQPRPVCVGGKVLPDLEVDRPVWLPPSLPGLPVCDLGDDPRFINFPEEFVIGANVAFDKTFLEERNGFPVQLGRKQGGMLSNEETHVLHAADECTGVYYQPDACVEHFIGAERLTLSYAVRRFYWQGISDWRMTMAQDGTSNRSTLKYLLLRRIGLTVMHLLRFITGLGENSRVTSLLLSISSVAYLIEALKQLIMRE